jgi:hypothetical protein
MRSRIASILIVAGLSAILSSSASAIAPSATTSTQVKHEQFDADPGWDAFRNRVAPTAPKTIQQDFGQTPTNFAGKEKGEIGGTIWRASKQASYADRIPAKTMNDPLHASGAVAITASSGSSGAFFGWFNSQTPEAGRQNTLGFRFSGEGSGARLTLQLVTATNQACGTKITPWIVDRTKPKGPGRKFRPTSIKNDGTRYTWNLSYDPKANAGDGQIAFTVRSNSDRPEDFEGKTFTVNLPKGYKDHGTTFDRFGLVNSFRAGNSMTLYFDDLEYNDKVESFSNDAGWIGVGNHDTYQRQEEGGAHDFGFSPNTHFAGAAPGELGGIIWRSGSYAYYADRVGPLSLDNPLEASGKVVLNVGPPDSGMYIGWFNSQEKELSPPQAGNFLAIKIGGPTRIGHYFLPAYATSAQAPKPGNKDLQHAPNISVERGQGPVLVPAKTFDWKITYDPAASDGQGVIQVTLGNQTVTLPLKNGDKTKGATFDRFGLFTTHRGGSYVKIHFDDLRYTASKPATE